MSTSASPKLSLKRRALLKAGVLGGAALCIGFRLPARGAVREAALRGTVFQPNAFLRIAEDGRVTAIVGAAEMGQGIFTALAAVLADELDAPWDSIRVEAAPVDPVFGNPFFHGIQAMAASTSVAVFYDTTRQAAAAARSMLVQAAANQWKVSPRQCTTGEGSVRGPSGLEARYGTLVAAAAALRPPAKKAVQLKDPKQFKLIGRPLPRLESREIVTGQLVYGLDFDLPGLLTAMVARAPVTGAKLRAYRTQEAAAVPGVRAIVELPQGVAVVADHYWAAHSARALLAVEWDLGPNAAFTSAELERHFTALAQHDGKIAAKVGDPASARRHARATVSAAYSVPFLAHAPMEPLNCTIRATPQGCDVWVGTQYPSLDRAVVARTLGLAPESVRVTTLHMGGGFGRRGSPNEDVVLETAQIVGALRAKMPGLAGRPIKNVWAREDDIRGGFYRPGAMNLLEATLDDAGAVTGWTHRIVAESPMRATEFAFLIEHGIDTTSVAGAKDLPYAVPNLLVTLQSPEAGPTVQWMRSVGNSNTCFAVESFVDELAHHAHADPLAFRRTLLLRKHGSEALARVLDLAAHHAGWGQPLPAGSGRGIAVHDFWGTKVAQIAEVTVEGDHVRVDRVVCVMDCGMIVNPDGVRNQIEGAIVFGLSAALYGEITFDRGQSVQSNFDDYPLLRMGASPRIEVYLVTDSTDPPGGVGEAAVPHIAPALCNAIFAASGRRIRHLPLAKSGMSA
ncbi:xanthine dehydrogenase family protein molybdopterin-binding subunit [Paraburkholderia sp. J63]|uniref:xanthine dehydrogenase family protein molybdopterin-binding subunit n=1 Tax=Paraburkholderia sp. J63 TaxID=2805434 RepID=UPI002ABE43C8|nr:molybdopterin cofactor-binding domain-containing protein [Paraburkholderia sp. J63]